MSRELLIEKIVELVLSTPIEPNDKTTVIDIGSVNYYVHVDFSNIKERMLHLNIASSEYPLRITSSTPIKVCHNPHKVETIVSSIVDILLNQTICTISKRD